MGGKPRVNRDEKRQMAVVLWNLMTDEQLEQVLRNVAAELERRRLARIKYQPSPGPRL